MKRTLTIPELSTEDITRFWNRVEVGDNSQCWPFKGVRRHHLEACSTFIVNKGGTADTEVDVMAYRVAWFLHNRKQPGMLYVCHTCDNGSCCNPYHLYLGTAKDNSLDMVKKGRMNKTNIQGENNCRAKTNRETVLEIRRLHELGYMNIAIAKMFNLSKKHISKIVTRRLWHHI